MLIDTDVQTAHRICSRCIMDTSDPGIEFAADGTCNRCRVYEQRAKRLLKPLDQRRQDLAGIVRQVRRAGAGKEYDCVIGVSGGVDSTYVAWLTKSLGLRPLAIHLDNGWNSNLAVQNIERSLKALSIDLHTCVLDWDEFRDLQLAFLKASTPDSEIPTDHAISALLYRKAAELGIRYVMSGANTATEGLAVPTWSCGHFDWKYIHAIHNRFGSLPLKTYPYLNLWNHWWFRHVRRIRMISLLDYVDYRKADAMAIIEKDLGWRPYPGKHHESIYTRYFQCGILPAKFHADKRRVHLSTLIMSGQTTRQEALYEMGKPPCSADELRLDKLYVCKKLGLSEREFDGIMNLPAKSFWDYPSYERGWLMKIYRLFHPIRMR